MNLEFTELKGNREAKGLPVLIVISCLSSSILSFWIGIIIGSCTSTPKETLDSCYSSEVWIIRDMTEGSSVITIGSTGLTTLS